MDRLFGLTLVTTAASATAGRMTTAQSLLFAAGAKSLGLYGRPCPRGGCAATQNDHRAEHSRWLGLRDRKQEEEWVQCGAVRVGW